MSNHDGPIPARNVAPDQVPQGEFFGPPQNPNGGGTAYPRPPLAPVDWFRRMPNGGQVRLADAPPGDPASSDPFAMRLRVRRIDEPADTNDTGDNR